MSIISENIKRVRIEKHMEQKDLADKLNVSNKTVSSWECGRTEPRMGMIEKLCQALNCTKADLIEPPVETFDAPAAFELAWHKSGGGAHPLNLSYLERELVLAFRNADPTTQDNICKLLDVKKDSESSKEA